MKAAYEMQLEKSKSLLNVCWLWLVGFVFFLKAAFMQNTVSVFMFCPLLSKLPV